METITLTAFALALLGYGLVSRRAERSVVTPPMVFVLLGIAGASFGLIEIDAESRVIHLLTELTLVLVLFTDASRIDVRVLRTQKGLPLRMLLIGLPLSIAAGTAMGLAFYPGWTWSVAAVLATVLAPTDAALGQPVVGNTAVPVRIRQALNVESGLNDGLALPALLVFLSICAAGHSDTPGEWIRFGLLQVTLGPLVGMAVGWSGGRLVAGASRSGWMNDTFEGVSAVALALLAFGGAESIGGNGFIAAFVAGMTLGNTARHTCGRLHEFGEAEGQLLTLIVFALFGAVFLPGAIPQLRPVDFGYAAASLTVVRVVPIALSLIGSSVRPPTVLFLGWFGPRGLASILFALLVLHEWDVVEADRIAAVAYLTVVLSVFAHGLTAFPMARAFGRWIHSRDDAVEHADVAEMPTRMR